jgi:death-on-curing protein
VNEPIWISKKAVLAMHSAQLAEHGGSDGIRDETLLDSALAKPLNVFAYADQPDIFRLAASYAFGIARNRAFVDGNKRTALVVSITFLDRNGWDIVAPKGEVYFTFLHLADGSLSEDELTDRFTKHAVSL